MRTDVAIVGAGLFGSALAVALAREGMSVAIHDRAQPAAGDTGRSFGMVRAHYSNEVTIRLARRGIELLAGDPRSGYVRTGYMLPVASAIARRARRTSSWDSRWGSTRACSRPRPLRRSSPRFAPTGSRPRPTSRTVAWSTPAG